MLGAGRRAARVVRSAGVRRAGRCSVCSTAVVPPGVRETGRTVAVHLVRAPMSRPDGGCAGRRRLHSSVDIRLDRPMNGRLLADLTHHGELVTPAHAAP